MWLVALALASAHCGGSADSPAPGAGGDSPGNTPDAGPRGGDGGQCVSTGRDDPDDQGLDTNCDGADGVVGVDVYVSFSAGQDTNDGTPQTPMRTLAAAIKLASGRNGHVLVAAGEAPADKLDQAGTWSVYGGYEPSFVGAPKRTLTILDAPATGLLLDHAATARLAHLTVKGAAPDANQTTAHALRTRVQTLALDDVEIVAADGYAGAAGKHGAAGEDGGSGLCSGVLQPFYAAGVLGTSPDGVTTPGYVSSNVLQSQAAAQAQPGSPGTDGADASNALHIVSDLVAGETGQTGLADGRFGFGGAGGGNGYVNGTYYSWGEGGSGGCPGKGSDGGESGGSAVAVLVLSGHVDITRSHLQTGFAGTGGDGGAAGPGGKGAWGHPPTSPSNNLAPKCTKPSDDTTGANCATYGGQGGDGGSGGRGGGGAGGSSVGVATASGSDATLDAATIVDLGRPGYGGAGNGGGRAPNGETHITVSIR
jgi:hypothetical protein